MKTNVSKKVSSLVLALAIVFTAVFATVTPVEAAEDYSIVYEPTEGTASAGQEVKIPFTLTENQGIEAVVLVASPVTTQLALYDSQQNLVTSFDNNPLTVYSSEYSYSNDLGYYYEDAWNGSIPAGDYYYGVTFAEDQNYIVSIAQYNVNAKISQKKATITKGFTKKLTVSGGKVKSWSSSKKSVATVDKKTGKVTAKKAGKTTITATLTNGKKLKCNVTVKDNKYSQTKPTTSDVSYGNCAMRAYSASFDSKGNLVIKTRFVNNDFYKVVSLKNIKIVVRDGNGKLVGTYKLSKKSVSIPSGSTKDLSFTIKKSSLKKKTADLRNSSITCDGIYEYYY